MSPSVSNTPINCPGCGLFWADERIVQVGGAEKAINGYIRKCSVCGHSWSDLNFNYTKLRAQQNAIGGRFVQWLRKVRFTTEDYDKVDKSIFQWGVRSEKDRVVYTLSFLGIINGPLPKIGLGLFVTQDDSEKVTIRLQRWKKVVR